VDLILVIGTSGVVYPAAGYAWSVKMRGGKVAVFNIESDEDSQADWTFEGIVAKHLATNGRSM
jgi:NAD-dependent deacetylase sirtuin 5